jgi:cytosine/adenosine deaminase-related metal-dependent hydrolase
MFLSAQYILPITQPPIRKGWIETAEGRIVRVGQGAPPAGARDLGDVALLPGLVNAHTHLELSWLAGRIRPAASIVDWIRALMAERSAGPTGGDAAVTRAARATAADMRRSGTVLVGDISNSLISPAILREAGLGGIVFHEIVGFNVQAPVLVVQDAWRRVEAVGGSSDMPSDGARGPALEIGVVGHAPYSVSAALMSEIARHDRGVPLSVHVAESAEEIEFLRSGTGPFRELLEDLDVWNPAWEVPQCDPVEYLRQVDYLKAGLLAVHAVHLSDDALDALREAGAVVVTCPRSNEWVGGGIPRVTHFYAAGIPVAIGTDSLASAPSVSLFDELAELRRIAPDVTAASLLDSATRVGAEALGRGADYGTLAPGRRARLVSVAIPPGTTDVEEYLVSGVPPAAVRPIQG